MNRVERARAEGRGYHTSIHDEDLHFHTRGLNARIALLPVGEPGDIGGPVAGVIHVNPGPGDPLRGHHMHFGDAINLVVQGALCMDGTWLRPGQAKIVPKYFTYGDAVPSAQGCIFLEIFEDHGGAMPEFADPEHERYYQEVHAAVANTLGGKKKKPPDVVPRPMYITKFDEPDDTWLRTGPIASKCVFMGTENDPAEPACMTIVAERDTSDLIASQRAFGTTTMMVVLRGTVLYDGKWMGVGDIYMSPPKEMSGDLVIGPEGAVIFLMFANRSGMVPTFADARDQENFDTLLRKDVEKVARGEVEKSVSVLPLRHEHTSGRAIVYRSAAEVEKYRAENPTIS